MKDYGGHQRSVQKLWYMTFYFYSHSFFIPGGCDINYSARFLQGAGMDPGP